MMATVLAPFSDVEDALLILLDDLGPNGTFKPAGVTDFILVYAFTGSDDRITDTPRVGIDVFAPTRTIGLPRAEAVRQRMLAAPHAVTTPSGVVVIDSVRTGQRPVEIPYGDSQVRRWESSYTVELRRPTTR